MPDSRSPPVEPYLKCSSGSAYVTGSPREKRKPHWDERDDYQQSNPPLPMLAFCGLIWSVGHDRCWLLVTWVSRRMLSIPMQMGSPLPSRFCLAPKAQHQPEAWGNALGK